MKKTLLLTTLLPILAIGSASAQMTDNASWQYFEGKKYSNSSSSYTQKYDSTFGMGLHGMYGWTNDKEAKDMGGINLDFHANVDSISVVHEFALNIGYFFTDQKNESFTNDLWSDRFQYTSAFADAFGVSHSDMVWALSQYDTLQDLVAEEGAYVGISDIQNLQGGKRIKINGRLPILFGYTVNIPISHEKFYIYLGAKAGITLSFKDVTEYASADVKYSGSDLYSPMTESRSRSSVLGDFTYAFNAGIRVSLNKSTDLKLGYELMKIKDIDPYHMITASISWNF